MLHHSFIFSYSLRIGCAFSGHALPHAATPSEQPLPLLFTIFCGRRYRLRVDDYAGLVSIDDMPGLSARSGDAIKMAEAGV